MVTALVAAMCVDLTRGITVQTEPSRQILVSLHVIGSNGGHGDRQNERDNGRPTESKALSRFVHSSLLFFGVINGNFKSLMLNKIMHF